MSCKGISPLLTSFISGVKAKNASESEEEEGEKSSRRRSSGITQEQRDKFRDQKRKYEEALNKLEDQLYKLKEHRESLKEKGAQHEDEDMKGNAKMQVH